MPVCAHECSMQFYAWLYSTRGYIPHVAIFHAWTYSTRGHIPRVDIFHACMAIFHAWDYTRRTCCTLLGNVVHANT